MPFLFASTVRSDIIIIMKRLKLYLETSVWNFYFADDAPEKRAETLKLFEEIRGGKYEVYLSELAVAEIDQAKEGKRASLKMLIDEFQPIELEMDASVEELSEKYTSAGIVPSKYENDVIHIAYAVANEMDVVVSWNMKHIVKLKTRMEINGINKIYGYKEIELCTPAEVIENED
jgi:predicted nucleic acid-binding protein